MLKSNNELFKKSVKQFRAYWSNSHVRKTMIVNFPLHDMSPTPVAVEVDGNGVVTAKGFQQVWFHHAGVQAFLASLEIPDPDGFYGKRMLVSRLLEASHKDEWLHPIPVKTLVSWFETDVSTVPFPYLKFSDIYFASVSSKRAS